ncbi:MAG: PilZ domain-containing protein [Bdellovibrio sp.]
MEPACRYDKSMPAIRYATQEQALLEVYGQNISVAASIFNLSQTGACLEGPFEQLALEPGDLLRLTVEMPRIGKRRHLNAQVVWKSGSRAGVRFISSNELLNSMVGKGL